MRTLAVLVVSIAVGLSAGCDRTHVARLAWIDPLPDGMRIVYTRRGSETGNSFRYRRMDVVLLSNRDPDVAAMRGRLMESLQRRRWRVLNEVEAALGKFDDEGGCIFIDPLDHQGGVPERVRRHAGPLLFVRLSFC